jgi:hypothetical protein
MAAGPTTKYVLAAALLKTIFYWTQLNSSNCRLKEFYMHWFTYMKFKVNARKLALFSTKAKTFYVKTCKSFLCNCSLALKLRSPS